MIRQGKSLSGRERNCCFLNLGGKQFADVSAVASLDLIDDSRAVALTDWDQDGDLDIWLTNRTGPRIRFLRNDLPTENRFLAVRLEGNPLQGCNRDAIGARLELHLGGDEPRKIVRTLSAGDSYLSQSSKWVYFGLGISGDIQRLMVRWPGNVEAESFAGLLANKRYQILQGSGNAVPLEKREPSVAIRPQQLNAAPLSDRSRVVLLEPLDVGELSYVDPSGKAEMIRWTLRSPVLINLWGASCVPCIQELKDFVKHAEKVWATGLRIVALNIDNIESGSEPTNPQAKQILLKLGFPFASGLATAELVQRLDELQRKVIYRERPLPLPSSFLIDGQGQLAIVYKGPVDVEQLVEDVKHLARPQERRRDFAIALPGRWTGDHFLNYPIAVSNEYLEGGYLEDARAHLEEYLEREAGFQDVATSEEARQRNVRLADVHNALAVIAYGNGQMAATLQHYEKALKYRRKFPSVENNLAWLLATLPDAALRNGARAVELAEGICRRFDYQELLFLDTLAAAYAEVARFQDALDTARKAVEMAEAQENKQLADEIRNRWKLYEENRPYREG